MRIMCAQPDDLYYTWQVHLWLESLKERGISDKALVLIFISKEHKDNFKTLRENKWRQVINLYPEAEFVFYNDEHKISNLLPIYIPVLRPYIIWRYWADHSEMKEETVLYCDCDVLFTEQFSVDELLNDDVCYLSDTVGYIGASYFDSKVKDVLPEKLEEYKKIDVLDEVGKLIGINREIAVKNNAASGGAQYLLKRVDDKFWSKVLSDVITIRMNLQDYNKRFFADEDKGFQSWCADMWAVLWNLWYFGKEVKVVKEMDFAWATDPITKLGQCGIFHNAGIAGNKQDGYSAFYKGKYVNGQDPTKDPYMRIIMDDENSQKHCTWWYAFKLMQLSNKYKLNY